MLEEMRFAVALHTATGGRASAEDAYALVRASARFKRLAAIKRARGTLTVRQERARDRTWEAVGTMTHSLGGQAVRYVSGRLSVRIGTGELIVP